MGSAGGEVQADLEEVVVVVEGIHRREPLTDHPYWIPGLRTSTQPGFHSEAITTKPTPQMQLLPVLMHA